MVQLNDVRQRGEAALARDRRINWAPFVVLLGFTCTLAWVVLWIWTAIRAFRAILS
jgi:hypothetical protein